jgi:D-glycero-D-manno-heptose 1,7-bisphosphate phosphatase
VKVVFIDRDGVVNEFPGNGKYVTTLKGFRFIPGSLEAVQKLTEEGFKIFVISNQAGISKGIYPQKKLEQINNKMLTGVKKAGGKIRGTYYCTHRSDEGCDCRKPEIGMIRQAMRSIRKTVRSARGSFFVGDTKSDMLTGYNAGCRTILVLTGRAKRHHTKNWGVKPDFIVKDLRAATRIILNHHQELDQSV